MKINKFLGLILLVVLVFTPDISKPLYGQSEGNATGAISLPATAPASDNATYITQTPDGDLTNEQALNALSDGILKHASGVVAPAVPGTDYLTPTGTEILTNKTIDSDTNEVHADATYEKVRNVSGGTLTAGTPVYASGYNAGQDRTEVEPADANVAATMPAIGIVEEDILNNANGHVIEIGVVENIDTTGTPVSESWSVGDMLYISTTVGTLTNIRPTVNGDMVQFIATVTRSHATLGRILVQGAGRTNDIPNNLTMVNTGAYRTGTTAADTALFTAYDVDGVAYIIFATLTAGDDPFFIINEIISLNRTAGDLTIQTTTSGNVILSPAGLIVGDSVTSGLTASTTQSQGQGALTRNVNEVSTVANPNDARTLPSAVAGIECVIINNGANTLQIFPASGDNLGTGVDTSEELERNETVKYVAYDDTNWKKESSTEIIHSEMHDEDNTDVFVVNDAGADFHSYHTNAMAAGDLADWTFDIGGGGTSFPIASIVDGAASGVDIEITTTGTHGLAVGDIISQTNLADAAYVGIFKVKAIISTTQYEVAAVFTATGTGTVDQATTLIAGTGSAGAYHLSYWISATSATNNETFDFQLYKEASAIVGTKVRRKFGTAADFGSMSGGGIVSIADGDKISLVLSNEDSASNITVRNFTLTLIRL